MLWAQGPANSCGLRPQNAHFYVIPAALGSESIFLRHSRGLGPQNAHFYVIPAPQNAHFYVIPAAFGLHTAHFYVIPAAWSLSTHIFMLFQRPGCPGEAVKGGTA